MKGTLTEEIVKAAREVFVEPKKTTDGKKFPLLVYKKVDFTLLLVLQQYVSNIKC